MSIKWLFNWFCYFARKKLTSFVTISLFLFQIVKLIRKNSSIYKNYEIIKCLLKNVYIEHLNGIQWSWVQIPLRPTFYSYFKESFSDEYHMYQLIPLHSCDYLNKISIKTNVATDEGNSRNEMWHWTNDETGVAVQSWLWVQAELIAW